MGVTGREDETRYEHESYGMVRFARGSGSKRLFGSSLSDHHTFVTLTICQGYRVHSLARDWYGGGKQLIEVTLSSHQFAQLLTTMNVGEGVPCTIEWVGDKHVPEAPAAPLEAEKIRADFADVVEKVATRAAERERKAKEILAKPSITKKDREELAGMFAMHLQDVRADIPFWQESFEEAAEKTVAHVKAEVDAFVTHAVVTAGVEALSLRGTEPSPPPELTDGEEPK